MLKRFLRRNRLLKEKKSLSEDPYKFGSNSSNDEDPTTPNGKIIATLSPGFYDLHEPVLDKQHPPLQHTVPHRISKIKKIYDAIFTKREPYELISDAGYNRITGRQELSLDEQRELSKMESGHNLLAEIAVGAPDFEIFGNELIEFLLKVNIKPIVYAPFYFKEITTTKPSLKDLLETLPFKI